MNKYIFLLNEHEQEYALIRLSIHIHLFGKTLINEHKEASFVFVYMPKRERR